MDPSCSAIHPSMGRRVLPSIDGHFRRAITQLLRVLLVCSHETILSGNRCPHQTRRGSGCFLCLRCSEAPSRPVGSWSVSGAVKGQMTPGQIGLWPVGFASVSASPCPHAIGSEERPVSGPFEIVGRVLRVSPQRLPAIGWFALALVALRV